MKNTQKEPVSAMVFIDQTLEKYADCDANLKEINSAMDKEILEIRKKYAEPVTQLQQQKDAAFNELESFAIINQDILFSLKRSVKTNHGTFGFRTGKPRFNLFEGVNWATVTNLMKDLLPGYVRMVAEPSKEKLMADRNLPEVARYFPALGMNVVQDETFFIDLKK